MLGSLCRAFGAGRRPLVGFRRTCATQAHACFVVTCATTTTGGGGVGAIFAAREGARIARTELGTSASKGLGGHHRTTGDAMRSRFYVAAKRRPRAGALWKTPSDRARHVSLQTIDKSAHRHRGPMRCQIGRRLTTIATSGIHTHEVIGDRRTDIRSRSYLWSQAMCVQLPQPVAR